MSTETEQKPHRTEGPKPELEELHLHRLLVAVDGSATAELALSAAVTAAQRDNAAVTLLAVIPNLATESGGWAMSGAPAPQVMQEDIDHEAEQMLRDTVNRMPKDIPVTTVIRHGKPGPEIVAAAEEAGDFDAILVGARGLGRVRAMVGSVSTYVLSHAKTDVFVAHPRPEED